MHQTHAATEDEPVHQRQHRFTVVVNRDVEGVLLDEEIFVQRVTAFETVVERADIATGTKCLFTGTA
ncbi:hypothetical protein D3C81_1679630 [compost metagenome]